MIYFKWQKLVDLPKDSLYLQVHGESGSHNDCVGKCIVTNQVCNPLVSFLQFWVEFVALELQLILQQVRFPVDCTQNLWHCKQLLLGCYQLVCGTDVSKIRSNLVVLENLIPVLSMYHILGLCVYAHVPLLCIDLWLYGGSSDSQWVHLWKSWLWFSDGMCGTESEHFLSVQRVQGCPGFCSFPKRGPALSKWQSWPLVCHCKHISLFIVRYCVCSLVYWVQKPQTTWPVILLTMQKIASNCLSRIGVCIWISASFFKKLNYMYCMSESCQMPVYA